MGKKDRGMKRKMTAEERAEEPGSDAELEAELQALAAIQAEREEAEESNASKNEGEEGGSRAGKKPKRVRGIYNKEGLEQACEDAVELPFLESYAFCEFECEVVVDENDDLARELAFYKQTMLAVDHGRAALKRLGVPVRRPDDYFAENVKSDGHMQRVKDKLLLETKKIDGFEKRRQRESNRKYNKQLQELRKKEKAQASKEGISDFTKLRKDGRVSGEELDGKVEALLKGRGQGDRGRSEKSKKRLNMDKKYGAGVKEHIKNKQNDKKSFNDMSEYNPRGGKLVRREKGSTKGAKGGGGKSTNRPGKERRQARRGSN